MEDLFELRLSDGTLVQAWEDEEFTYLTIAFVTLALPTEMFKEFVKVIANYHTEMEGKGVESLSKLEEAEGR